MRFRIVVADKEYSADTKPIAGKAFSFASALSYFMSQARNLNAGQRRVYKMSGWTCIAVCQSSGVPTVAHARNNLTTKLLLKPPSFNLLLSNLRQSIPTTWGVTRLTYNAAFGGTPEYWAYTKGATSSGAKSVGGDYISTKPPTPSKSSRGNMVWRTGAASTFTQDIYWHRAARVYDVTGGSQITTNPHDKYGDDYSSAIQTNLPLIAVAAYHCPERNVDVFRHFMGYKVDSTGFDKLKIVDNWYEAGYGYKSRTLNLQDAGMALETLVGTNDPVYTYAAFDQTATRLIVISNDVTPAPKFIEFVLAATSANDFIPVITTYSQIPGMTPPYDYTYSALTYSDRPAPTINSSLTGSGATQEYIYSETRIGAENSSISESTDGSVIYLDVGYDRFNNPVTACKKTSSFHQSSSTTSISSRSRTAHTIGEYPNYSYAHYTINDQTVTVSASSSTEINTEFVIYGLATGDVTSLWKHSDKDSYAYSATNAPSFSGEYTPPTLPSNVYSGTGEMEKQYDKLMELNLLYCDFNRERFAIDVVTRDIVDSANKLKAVSTYKKSIFNFVEGAMTFSCSRNVAQTEEITHIHPVQLVQPGADKIFGSTPSRTDDGAAVVGRTDVSTSSFPGYQYREASSFNQLHSMSSDGAFGVTSGYVFRPQGVLALKYFEKTPVVMLVPAMTPMYFESDIAYEEFGGYGSVPVDVHGFAFGICIHIPDDV